MESGHVSSGTVPLRADDVDRRIQRVSALEYHIDRTLREELLENKTPRAITGVRARVERQGDTLVGLRLLSVARGSVLSRIGLESGDLLRSINGFSIAAPDKALEAYARLRTTDDLRLALVRQGRTEELVVRFR
jgi:general secretion pathway protein C